MGLITLDLTLILGPFCLDLTLILFGFHCYSRACNSYSGALFNPCMLEGLTVMSCLLNLVFGGRVELLSCLLTALWGVLEGFEGFEVPKDPQAHTKKLTLKSSQIRVKSGAQDKG